MPRPSALLLLAVMTVGGLLAWRWLRPGDLRLSVDPRSREVAVIYPQEAVDRRCADGVLRALAELFSKRVGPIIGVAPAAAAAEAAAAAAVAKQQQARQSLEQELSAKVEQLPLPVPPAALMTPIARPRGGYLSTLPQPPRKLLTKP